MCLHVCVGGGLVECMCVCRWLGARVCGVGGYMGICVCMGIG